MNDFNILRNTLHEARAPGKELDVFFRDDDADDDLPNLHRLIDTFQNYAATVNLAVIPGTLTASGAELLLKRQERMPQCMELHQHGWIHANHESTGRKCEFGPSQSYNQQFRNILRGRERLTEVFGGNRNRLFIPPWNRCTRDTLRVLKALEFAGISRDVSAELLEGVTVREVPVTFDINTWKTGPRLKTNVEIADALSRQVNAGACIGVLLHHKVMTSEAFQMLDNVLSIFSSAPNIRIKSLGDLVGRSAGETIQTCTV